MFPTSWKVSLCVLAVSLAAAAQTVIDSGNGQPALLDQDSGVRVTLATDVDGTQVLRFTGVNSCSQGNGGATRRSKFLPGVATPFVTPAKDSKSGGDTSWQCGQRGVLTVKAATVQFASDDGTTRLDTASLSTNDDNGVYVISTGSSGSKAGKTKPAAHKANKPTPDQIAASIGSSIALQTGMAAEWVTGLIAQSLHDFSGAVARFRDLAKMNAPTPAGGDLTVTITPGGAQTYVDDEFKGVTSSEGRLVVKDVKPGAHTVRVDLPGYKELSQPVTISAGQNNDFKAALQRKGPDPLSEAEIEDGLKQGVTPVRMTALVQEIGVGFTMNDDIEKKLRALGADSDLILAIMKNKR
jgi:PEGA domain-containing protein